MSGYWEVIAPASVAAMGWWVILAARLARRPSGAHHADPAGLTVASLDVGSMTLAEERAFDGLPPWAAPEADRYNGYGWVSGSSGSSYGGWAQYGPDGYAIPPDLEATLRRELHHVDLWPEEVMPDGPGRNAPRLERQPVTGAGDESEGSGLTAPPAPLTATDLALARCDLFMVAMRADHERWLASARERWAAA